MENPTDSEWPASQSIALPPSDQPIQHAKHFPSYPYNITRATLYSSWMNLLLVFLPLGIITALLQWPDLVTFSLNFLAIIPLASLIAFSCRELSGSIGDVPGRLLKATLSNIFEIIVGVVAVSKGQILVAQSSLLGSMLFDSLLVLGSSVFFASLGVDSLAFSKILTNIMSSLIIVASVALIVPTTISPQFTPTGTEFTSSPMDNNILILSRTTAIVLLALFGSYVLFQVKTHKYLFLFLDPTQDQTTLPEERRDSALSEEEHKPTLSPWEAAFFLLASTVCIAICINFVISTADGLSKSSSVKITKIFIGMVLIPFSGNIGKCAALVAISRKKRIDFAIRTILNHVLQISLLIIPSSILIGWGIGQRMMLNFDVFEATVFLLAIIVVSYVVQDGKTNYFEGIMLIGTYIVIVVAFYIRPDATQTVIVPGPGSQ